MRLGAVRRCGIARRHVRDAEVEHLHQVAAVLAALDQDVVRLQIAMDDAGRLRRRQRVRDLRHDLAHAPPRHVLLLREQRTQAAPAHQLHHEVRATFRQRAVVDRARDVRMLELRGRHRLACEARRDLAVTGQLSAHDLERHRLVQREVLGDEHRAHAALAEQAQHAVAIVEHAAFPLARLTRRGGFRRLQRVLGRRRRHARGGLDTRRHSYAEIFLGPELGTALARHAAQGSTICARTRPGP